jgi:hypothetical protein
MGINCVSFLADLLLYSYEINFMQGFSRKTKRIKLTAFHYIVVLSLNNSKFGHYVDHIYQNELEIKDTIYS